MEKSCDARSPSLRDPSGRSEWKGGFHPVDSPRKAVGTRPEMGEAEEG